MANSENRIFRIPTAASSPGAAAVKTVIRTDETASVAFWRVPPGEEVHAHRHPQGQDTWVVLSGEAVYYLGGDQMGALHPGDIAVAGAGEVHGGRNTGSEELVFVSILSPASAGFAAVDDQDPP
ncbi:MAG: cupin domain-containing protein [Thermaerobacter sp.]|jgi:quercetin dioxygenase-like cupin family protein|nr:cupin domain-containing protein [Thermaerobacter sp.]